MPRRGCSAISRATTPSPDGPSAIRPRSPARRRWSPSIAARRAAAAALDGGRLIVAGSVNSAERISALSNAGAHAFTIGSAVFDGSFSPSKGGLRSQIRDTLDACRRQKQAVT
jgi:hypothetical protein